ncbi:head maturation protease, ClpP-related [Staphylococcus xylosus]|uniref:head maturation protease, ClpP-related n=1 Tax=Staphylococcus xylosus TaxID=1288 RepID=UPI001CDD9004|nr:head maturation protease, ClpP-related [Staphylococcus xylosus]MCQ3816704.1 Clp protease ClpP [Staphylococcus xylosus]MCQ3819243.1 Clp protease ClpP [Staphylococcus xylosus]UBV36671.1 Clp protease ClpP [Staphylococcus xylosus]
MKTKKELIKATSKYSFKNEVQDDKVILTLGGPVAEASIFADETINSTDIANVLDDVGKDVVIRLNSPGGDVFQGIEIHNYLKNHPSNITVEVTALAASAASIIAMAADSIVMEKGASIMIHEAATLAIGNKADIKKTLNALETIDESIVDIYQEKTNLDRDEISQMMGEETWFTAKDAVDKGFADKTKEKVETPKEPKVENNAEIIALREQVENLTNAVFKNQKDKPKTKRIL